MHQHLPHRRQVKAAVFLACESLVPGNGGICRVARLMARVIAEEVRAGRMTARALALSDERPALAPLISGAVAHGVRAKFAWEVQKAALTHSHFIYDFVGMARAHCRIPFLRKPFLTWIHGIEAWEGTRPDRVAWAKRADLLLSNSAYTRDRADRLHGGFAGARVCWLATEADEPPPPRPPHAEPPTVLLLGRFDEGDRYKGHRELIECWPKVAAGVPAARLVFVGQGPGRPAIEALAKSSPAGAQIEFRGFVTDDELGAVWAETSVFAMPSRGEGFGLVYIEAMRQGVPVVASVHDAAPEINLDGVTGFNVSLDNAEELPERLIYLLRNPGFATQLGRNGRERWRQHFRFSCFKERFLPPLHEFLG
jgi:phosphatidyl-myo-inositol dimannoside synthase